MFYWNWTKTPIRREKWLNIIPLHGIMNLMEVVRSIPVWVIQRKSYSESDFKKHLLGGILYCLNR